MLGRLHIGIDQVHDQRFEKLPLLHFGGHCNIGLRSTLLTNVESTRNSHAF